MSRYAKIIDSKVENVIELEDENIGLMPAEWVLVKSETANIGDDYINGVFIAQAPAYTEPVVIKTLSPIEFKLRFTAPERVAIYQSTDLIVKDFVSLLDDVRLTQVDLTLQSTIDAVGYLAAQGLIEQTRVSEILS